MPVFFSGGPLGGFVTLDEKEQPLPTGTELEALGQLKLPIEEKTPENCPEN